MSQDATVNAGDIARLVDVGRAAVSNWRRRYDDFPQPVGGTASSPLFSLREIEDWLRRNGKTYRLSVGDLAWQRLRADGDDLRLGERVAAAGAALLGTGTPDPDLVALAAERGPQAAFEFLCARYVDAHSRRLPATAPEIAALMVDLVAPAEGTVLDPACGLGTLLLAAPDGLTKLGQENDETSAAIAAVRLDLAGAGATVVTGDSLRADGLPGDLADAVLCDPPFHDRAWGYDELTSDPRWEYGLPPRGEPELAWVQHCLAHTRPGGQVAILMPAAAAGRRPGKRIRGNLLRAGALRAVVSVTAAGPDLWLLRRPAAGDRAPSHVLLLSAPGDLADVVPVWRRLVAGHEESATRIIDLLDDDVDLSPARRRRTATGADLVRDLTGAATRLRELGLRPPEFAVPEQPAELPMTTVGELVRAGVLTVHHPPGRMTLHEGDLPVLTADDLAAGGPATGRTAEDDGLVRLAEGDVVASVLGAARVLTDGGAFLGPYLACYRVDPDRLDRDFLAGLLRAEQPPAHGSSRIDARRIRVPRLSLAEQRRYGAAFRELLALDDALRAAAAAGETLVRLGFEGLVAGHLRPVERTRR
ncbi:MAG TPA: N-6 DNA methylase [Pseudonocardiaceae bacterium]|jgi:hypothetical protein|nr:N-6 DNA methylase [Pseudonocardiaceae bacterium]